ncbi:MAG: hypothetical protein RIC85_00920 [Gammaproteobacteria bacterium]
MAPEPYKYDIALSFLAADESLATEIADLLQDRFNVFLYSRKQEEIAGRDGELAFNSVFERESRMVAVLYRESWGETPWTRIERTAIRNRAYDEGYDFLIFIPLDSPPGVPKWLPKTQLYVGLSRWGVNGAASVLEDRISQAGGSPRVEGVTERARRLARSKSFAAEREQFRTGAGISASDKEFEILEAELERIVTELKKTVPDVSFTTKSVRNHLVIIGERVGCGIQWHRRFTNSLEESELEISFWRGHPPFPGVIFINNPVQVGRMSLNFDLLRPGEAGWKLSGPKGREFSSPDLAAQLIRQTMDAADKLHGKQ